MSDQMTLDAFIKSAGLTMTAGRTDSNPNMDSSTAMDHWKVTIRAGRSRMSTVFSMGYGHKGNAPTLADVLDCLASDASSVAQADYDEWARDMGYDTDSRKAERTYKACVRQGEKLKRLLGDSAYETLLYHTERL